LTIHVRIAMSADLADIVEVGRQTRSPTYDPLTGPQYVADGLVRFWAEDAVADLVDKGGPTWGTRCG
jgi:hypothetical protein